MYGKHFLTPNRHDLFVDMQIAGRDEDSQSSNTYPYITLWHEEFVKRVDRLLKPGMRVVDVGCGAGDKLLAFNELCNELTITGIEHHPVMAKVARYVAPFANVIEGDAFLQDFGEYDLVYMYRPIPDRFLQAQLQRHVMNTMRPGAILVVQLQEYEWGGEKDEWFPSLVGWVKPYNGWETIPKEKHPYRQR
jgi:SAM-dependent methyltransferase